MKRRPIRHTDIRLNNERLILQLAFQHGTISQSMVVKHTGLKAPTVFRIFAKLSEAGFISQCEDSASIDQGIPPDRKGRRPNLYCVNPTSGYALGIDFSSLGAAVIAVDFSNTVIYRNSMELSGISEREQVMEILEQLLQTALQDSRLPEEALLGIGVAAPGVVDTATGRVQRYARIKGLSGYSIKERLEQRFEVPVHVHNNASVIASSAYHYGCAREERSVLAILVRSGIGGALVKGGEIFLNGSTTALEIGSTSPSPCTPEQLLADSATLESMVAEAPLLNRLQQRYAVGDWNEADSRLSPAEINSALHEEQLAFATTVRNLYHIFHPDAVLLISRFPALSRFLEDSARAVLPESRLLPMVYDPVQACYGATDIVFREFFHCRPELAAGTDIQENPGQPGTR
ncbi:ROK family transcriptional regulator [Spirochaeta africana]|uniref:Transcriptional regulator/sugar kinase n=1 Tax=Spirochaeta africana (strain ATCC 700263 / DSM 8902 / Z-7692) TaxID=889378 RepID=H9UFE1_SPIAZ|nr:ROK family transcriptional regulator [Spirochaeta africana]AFG36234.1 transcriptional regulator/sugar kinase [Spirochaeta africana DSM 8902]